MQLFQWQRGRCGGQATCFVTMPLTVVIAVTVSWPAMPPGRAAETSPTEAKPAEVKPVVAELGLEELLNVEVSTVSRQESTVGQSPAAVFVITQEMIRRSGATTIPELLRMVPGMNVARSGTSTWAISARGFNASLSNKLLVQVDGRVVYQPVTSGVYWDTVDYPLEDIERIEIVRGPGASVWGANAVNGIINIITKSAADTQDGLLSGGGGNEEQGFGTVRYGGKLKNGAAYRVYGKGFSRDESFHPVADPHDAWWGARSGFRADWQTKSEDTVTLQGDYFQSDADRLVTLPQLTPPFTVTNRTSDVSKGANLLARWNRELSKDSSVTLQMYGDHVERNTQDGSAGLKWSTYDVDFQHQFRIGARQDFIYGLAYRLQQVTIAPSAGDNGFFLSGTKRNLNVFSAFAQDQIKLRKDKLTLTLGSKFEHNSFTGFEAQPSARLLWTPSKRHTAWASVSRAVRTPSLFEDDITLTAGAISLAPLIFVRLLPNPDFESEELLAYELGYRAQATDTLAVDVALFFNDYDKLSVAVVGAPTVDPVTGVNVLPVFLANGMKGKTYGAEVSTTWRPSKKWQLQGAYTLLGMQLNRDAGLAASAEAAERQIPRHQVYLRSSWSLPRDLELDLTGRFVDRLRGFASPVPSYVALDARLAWKARDNLELALIGQNLLDNHHRELGAVEIQRGVYGMATYRW